MADLLIITADTLQQRLAGTALPNDPTDVITLPGSGRWPAKMREQLQLTMQPAGVLIPIIDRADSGLNLLLTQRSAELKHHAGQISFPGGRMEADDADISVTALRETHEEVGIPPDEVSVIGYLEPMPTITGYAVTPIVGLVDEMVELKIDRTEVEFTFEVPLSFLLDKRNRRVVDRDLYGQKVPMIEFQFEGHRIWGATAFIIIEFIKIVMK
jgi:8-oxo-dGTP pyrophosphatase MutT (NUDIX family)